ncbi:MAG: hypothetical protein LBQ01_05960, partial [Prevotellaceae bacterium]|nr:hypothetical protein [Prevotellaceae bacterium]
FRGCHHSFYSFNNFHFLLNFNYVCQKIVYSLCLFDGAKVYVPVPVILPPKVGFSELRDEPDAVA